MSHLGHPISRDERRHHQWRVRTNRTSYWTHRNSMMNDPRSLGIAVKTPVSCSCHMCGNPRKHWNQMSLKEIEIERILNEELMFLDI